MAGSQSLRRAVFRHGRGGEPHNRIHEGAAAALVNEMSAAYGLDIAAAPEDMDIIYADAAHDYAGRATTYRTQRRAGPWSCWPARKAFWTRAIRPSPSGAFAILRGSWTAEPYLYIRAARPSVDAGASGRFCGGLLELNQTRQSHNHQLSWWLEQAL